MRMIQMHEFLAISALNLKALIVSHMHQYFCLLDQVYSWLHEVFFVMFCYPILEKGHFHKPTMTARFLMSIENQITKCILSRFSNPMHGDCLLSPVRRESNILTYNLEKISGKILGFLVLSSVL